MYAIARIVQAIYQPVPVVSRLHSNPFNLGLIRLEKNQPFTEIRDERSLGDHLGRFRQSKNNARFFRADPFRNAMP